MSFFSRRFPLRRHRAPLFHNATSGVTPSAHANTHASGGSDPTALAASQITSGTFADSLIAESNVTQHEAALAIAASQITSGTFGAGNYTFPADLIVGSDPGGSSRLRVSGNARIADSLNVLSDTFAFMVLRSHTDTTTLEPTFVVSRSRGTEASPTQLLSGDVIGRLYFQGYHSGGSFRNNAHITVKARENLTASGGGMDIEFDVTAVGETGLEFRFGIGTDGDHVKVVGNRDAEMITFDRTAHADVNTLFHTGVRGVVADTEEYWEVRNGAFGATNIRFSVRQDGRIGTHLTGSASVTTVGPQSDVDTGWFFPSANTQAWSTAGVERLRLRSDGILFGNRDGGTAFTYTPNARVAAIFQGDDTLGTVINLTATALTGARQAEIWFGDRDTEAQGRLRYEVDNDRMEFWTNNTERMSINSSGSVVIGSDPGGSSILRVGGAISAGTANNVIIASFGRAEIVLDGTDGALGASSVGIQEIGGSLYLQSRNLITVDLDKDNNGTTGKFVVRSNGNSTEQFYVSETGLVRTPTQIRVGTDTTHTGAKAIQIYDSADTFFIMGEDNSNFGRLEWDVATNQLRVDVADGGTQREDIVIFDIDFVQVTQKLHATGEVEIDGNFNHDGSNIGVFGTAPAAKQTVTGSRSGNAALASLLTALAAYGLITDSSTV